MNLSPSLRADYLRLWQTMVIDTDDQTERATSIISHAVGRIVESRDRYHRVELVTRVPWAFIGVQHYREGSCNFGTHLHNGDSLSARTQHVPRGRPVAGGPPFPWEVSAVDCLVYEGMDRWDDWSVTGMLYQWELFNGFGYRRYHPLCLSPYLWSYSNHEDKPGKYDADGHFDAELWDDQVGCAVILRQLIDIGAYLPKGDGP